MHVDYGTLLLYTFHTLSRSVSHDNVLVLSSCVPFLVSPSGSRIDDICCQYNFAC